MRRLTLIMLASAALAAVPAHAVTVVLQSTDASGGITNFNYGGSFATDPTNPSSNTPIEGLVTGSKVIIYDFAGYVPGSVFSPYANVTASAEYVSDPTLVTPGTTDDPTLANLVFTYTGPAVTPPSGFAFSGFRASSTYSGIDPIGATFGSQSVKVTNNTPLYVLGYVAGPMNSAVPEPASWAMMLAGFGLLGAMLRQNRRQIQPMLGIG